MLGCVKRQHTVDVLPSYQPFSQSTMSWWWKPQQSASTHADADGQSTSTSPSTSPKPSEKEVQPATTDEQPALSRDQQAFGDLKALLSSVNPEAAARASSSAKTYAESKPEFGDDEDSLYQSTMSCSQCFDYAYYCSSIGGQLNNVYRYGGMRSCSDLWAQWRFCMRTKAMDKDTARIKIREFNQRKVVKYKTGRSSEDVWTIRTEPLEGAFQKDPDTEPPSGS